MSTSKLAVSLAAIVAAIGFGSAIYEANIAKQAAAESALLRQQQKAVAATAADLEAKWRAAEQRGEVTAARGTALEKDLAQARQSAAGAASRPATTASGPPWNDPAYAHTYLEKYRTSLGLRYGPFYRTLALSPDQIAKFETALMESEQGMVDIWAAASSQGLLTDGGSATSTSVARMTSGPIMTAQETLKAMLGENGFEKYQQFNKTRPARDFVTSLAGSLYYSESPLTAQQGDALTEIVKTNTKALNIPMVSDGKSPLFIQTNLTDWEAVSAQAQAFLSPSQLATLRSLGEQAKLAGEMSQIQYAPKAPAGKQPGS
jgi:hypothetical protein